MARSRLEIDSVIMSAKNNAYTVTKELNSSGGQGCIYLAKCLGEDWVIKWYWQDDPVQRKHIQDMVIKGRPSNLSRVEHVKFLWPVDFLSNGRSFGYVMEYIDTSKLYNYEAILLHGKYGGPKWDHEMLCEMSTRLLKGFYALHSAGYCYMDISRDNLSFDKDKNIFVFDPDNIQVNDPERIDATRYGSTVSGTPGFIAPEILNGINNPNTKTDLWQMSVFLFLLWVKHHPFDGELVLNDDRYNDMNLLCSDPHFIFDPSQPDNYVGDDKENFGYVNAWWAITPKPMKELFMKAFTQGIDPVYRVYEAAWVNAAKEILEKELTTCPHCSHKVNKYAPICMYCFGELPQIERDEPQKQKPQPPEEEEYEGMCIIVFENNQRKRIFRTDLGISFTGGQVSSFIGGDEPFASIVANPLNPNIKGIKNETQTPWHCTKQDGSHFEVQSGASMVLRHRNKFVIDTPKGKVGILVYNFDR